jgi:hypothetical protein
LLYPFFNRVWINKVLIILFSLDTDAIEVPHLAKTGDGTGRAWYASLSEEARSLFDSQDISRRVWTVLASCRDMTSIGIEPWIVVRVHLLIVTQLCLFTKEACQEGRGATLALVLMLALVGEQAQLVGSTKPPAKLANAATKEAYRRGTGLPVATAQDRNLFR